MPRDVLHVEATATYNMGRGWSKSGTVAEICKPGAEQKALKSVVTIITPATVADRRVAYHLGIEPSSSRSADVQAGSVERRTPHRINYSAEDKRFENRGQINLKSVAGIAGTVIGVDNVLAGAFMAGRFSKAPRPR
jgi:hypothetical protein